MKPNANKINKASFLFASFLISTNCFSEDWTSDWRVFGNFPTAAHYLDINSLKKMPNGTYRILEKRRFKSSEKLFKVGVKSGAVYQEIDCHEEKLRGLSYQLYTGEGLDGVQLSSEGADKEWRYASPGTFDDLKLMLVCKKQYALSRFPKTEEEYTRRYQQ